MNSGFKKNPRLKYPKLEIKPQNCKEIIHPHIYSPLFKSLAIDILFNHIFTNFHCNGQFFIPILNYFDKFD